jgi:hypothetical protein
MRRDSIQMKAIFFICILLLASGFKSYSQQFINGSFEQNRVNDCDSLNLTNSAYNSLLDSVYGIGTLPGNDLMVDSCSLYQSLVEPFDGHYFSSLESGWDTINTTAISFLLSQPLITHNPYIISFYAKSIKNISQFYPIKLIVGYSNDNFSYGTPVDTTEFPDTIWTKQFVFLQPEYDASYITVRGLPGSMQLFTIVDKFSFDTTGLYVPYLQTQSLELFPNPANKLLNVKAQNLSYIKIYNVIGEFEHAPILNADVNFTTVDISGLPNGIYFLQAMIDERLIIRKFLKY